MATKVTLNGVNELDFPSSITATIFDGVTTLGGSFDVLVKTLTLTSSQLQNLVASPVTLISSPGTGKFIQLISALFQYKAGATPYTLLYGGGAVQVEIVDNNGEKFNVNASGFLDQAASQLVSLNANNTAVIAQVSYADQPATVINTSGYEWTAGDGTLTITVYYTIITLS
jgi:hypothetical protein